MSKEILGKTISIRLTQQQYDDLLTDARKISKKRGRNVKPATLAKQRYVNGAVVDILEIDSLNASNCLQIIESDITAVVLKAVGYCQLAQSAA